VRFGGTPVAPATRYRRAIRSYQAVGFVHEGRQRQHIWSDGGYVDVVLMALLRKDFAAARSGQI